MRSYVKAAFLADVAKGEANSPLINAEEAVRLLGTMLGGYNIMPLVELLDHDALAANAAAELKNTLLMFDAFHDVAERAKNGNAHAEAVLESWAEAEWFTRQDNLPEAIKMVVFKVTGETNTDDLSPAQDAWSRPDIPLHALAMLKSPRDGITNAIEQINGLKDTGLPVAYVGDVVGTGSSRKSATNSVLWHMGNDIPFVPNKRQGGVVLGSKIAPIFNTVEDSGPCPSSAPRSNEHGRRHHHQALRRGGRERSRGSHLRVFPENPSAPGRGEGRGPYSADHWPQPDGAGPGSAGPWAERSLPPS